MGSDGELRYVHACEEVIHADDLAELRSIEAAARAHVECLARSTTEAYCDEEERALRVALGLPPLSAGGEGET